MKANIPQLAKQAGLNTDYIDYFGPKLLEQFAKVIAEECLKVSNMNADLLEPTQHDMALDIRSNNVSLREHFGI